MATKKANATKTAKKATKPAAASATKTKITTVKASATPRRQSPLSGLKFARTPILSSSLAEFVGTFLLAVMILLTRNEPIYMLFGVLGIALAFAALSGAHLNPAISVGAWVTRKLSGIRALAYVIAQALGAMLAFVVVSAYVNGAPSVSNESMMLGQQNVQIFSAADIPEGKAWGIFFAELMGLAVLGFAYASAYRSRHRLVNYSLTIGAGLFVALLVAGGLTAYLSGTAVLNPAAAISVQAIQWDLWSILSYVVAPLAGAIIGFGLHKLLAVDETVAEKETAL